MICWRILPLKEKYKKYITTYNHVRSEECSIYKLNIIHDLAAEELNNDLSRWQLLEGKHQNGSTFLNIGNKISFAICGQLILIPRILDICHGKHSETTRN